MTMKWVTDVSGKGHAEWEPESDLVRAWNSDVMARGLMTAGELWAWALTPTEIDKRETAAWYGRGEKPAHAEVSFELDLSETRKPAKPGLFVVQGEGRYQGLGFNGESK